MNNLVLTADEPLEEDNKLEQYLRKNITVHDWDTMPGRLRCSPTKWARLVSGTDEWPAYAVFELAEILNVHWYYDLVVPFGIGATTITLDHAQTALNAEGMKLDIVDHAA